MHLIELSIDQCRNLRRPRIHSMHLRLAEISPILRIPIRNRTRESVENETRMSWAAFKKQTFDQLTSSCWVLKSSEMPDKSSRYFDDSNTLNKNSCPFALNSPIIFYVNKFENRLVNGAKERITFQLTFEHAMHCPNRSVAGKICSKLLSWPRIECGTMPNIPSGIFLVVAVTSALATEMYAGHWLRCGCWIKAISNSTAKLPAIFETAGRVTVHCWSSVRSFCDWKIEKGKQIEFVCAKLPSHCDTSNPYSLIQNKDKMISIQEWIVNEWQAFEYGTTKFGARRVYFIFTFFFYFLFASLVPHFFRSPKSFRCGARCKDSHFNCLW